MIWIWEKVGVAGHVNPISYEMVRMKSKSSRSGYPVKKFS